MSFKRAANGLGLGKSEAGADSKEGGTDEALTSENRVAGRACKVSEPCAEGAELDKTKWEYGRPDQDADELLAREVANLSLDFLFLVMEGERRAAG